MVDVRPIVDSSTKNIIVYEKLSKFVTEAELFIKKNSDKNVALQYLRMSGSRAEISQLIQDLSNTNDENVVLLFKTLRYILIQISTDPKQEYLSLGTSLANEVLAYGSPKILSFLKLYQKPKLAVTSIHLLSSMSGLGPEVATNVFIKFNISSGLQGHHLFKKRSELEEEDVRSAFINLISLFISAGNNSITHKLLFAKNFLSEIFPGLLFDSAEVIILILSTLTDYIILKSSIDKASKHKLFNGFTTKVVAGLFMWEGPVVSNSKKRKFGKDPEIKIMQASEEDKRAVRNAVYQYLLVLCTSDKNGVMFRDFNFGLYERNCNTIVTNVLLELPKPYIDVKVSEFITAVLKACPDQLQFYLPTIKDSFAPRLSVVWLEMISFIKKVISSQDIVTLTLKSGRRMTKSKFKAVAKLLVFPDIISDEEITVCFKNGHPHVCYHLLDYILCILNQVIRVFDFCHEENSSFMYSSSDLKSYSNLLISDVRKYFRSMNYLQSCWNNLINPVLDGSNMDEQEIDFNASTLNDQLLKFFDVVQAFQHICPSFCELCNINVIEMNEQLKKCVELTPEQLATISTKIVNILTVKVDAAIELWKKDMTKSIFMDVINIYATDSAQDSIYPIVPIFYKILLKTNIFSCCLKEADVWLHELDNTHPSNLLFVAKTFNNALHIAMQETDKDFKEENSCSVSQETNLSKNLKDDSLCNLQDYNVSDKQNFTFTVSAVLQCLSHLKGSEKKVFQNFVESTLKHIIHYQSDLENIFSLIKNYESSLSSKFYSYCQLIYLLSKGEKVKEEIFEKCCRKKEKKNKTAEMLQYYFCLRHARKDSEFDTNVINDLRYSTATFSETTIHCLRNIAWQVQLYIKIEILLPVKETETRHILEYQNVLEQLITEDLNNTSTSRAKQDSLKYSILCIVKDFLQNPMTLNCFLYKTGHIRSECKKQFYEYAHFVAQMVVKITNKLNPLYRYCLKEYLLPFKKKVVSFCGRPDRNEPQEKKHIFNEVHFSPLLESLATAFSTDDICFMLESLLTNSSLQNLEFKVPAILMLLNLYINQDEFFLLSKPAIQGLFAMYAAVQTEKSSLKKTIIQLLKKRPLNTKYVYEEFTLSLMNSSEDLSSLLHIYNKEMQKTIRLAVLNNVVQFQERGPEFLCLTSICLSGNISDDIVETFVKPIYSTFWKSVADVLKYEVDEPPQFLIDCNLCESVELLFKKSILSEKKVKKFFRKVFKNTCDVVPSPWRMNTILHLITLWRQYMPNAFSFHNVFKTTFHWLVTVISSTGELENFEHYNLLKFFPVILPDLQNTTTEELSDCNRQLTENYKDLLKVALKNKHIGPHLLIIVGKYCENMKNPIELPTQAIYELTIKNSSTLNILSGSSENNSLKEHVVDLLTALVKLDCKVCQQSHISLLLSAYNASLTTVDEKLLCLIKAYEASGVDMTEFRPFLWGESSKCHYSNSERKLRFLDNLRTKEILSMFTKEKILYTVANFPLEMELEPKVMLWEKHSEQNKIKYDDVYDLRFILPMLYNLLYSGSFVNCEDFIDSRAVSLVFASLGSYNKGIRSLGYYCLSQFYYHLKMSLYCDKNIWLYILDSLRNSITTPSQKLSSIITLFLTKFLDVMQMPGKSLFKIVSKYLTIKSTLDVDRVPEFYILFNSTETEHRFQRMWILNLLTNGLRSSLDFSLCRKQYIFETFLSYFDSSLSIVQEKVKILHFISAAAKIPKAFKLICQCGLLTWLNNVLSSRNTNDPLLLKNFIIIMHDLWHTFLQSDALKEEPSATEPNFLSTKDMLHRSFPSEFFIVLLRLLEKINPYNRNDDTTSYLHTFLAVMKFMKSDQATSTSNLPRLSFQSVAMLLKKWEAMETSAHTAIASNSQYKNGSIAATFGNIEKDKLPINLIFTEVFLCWQPLWNDINEDSYKKQLELFVKVLILMLQNSLHSPLHSNDVARWLIDCIKGDKQSGLLPLVSTTEATFTLFFQHLENLTYCIQRQNATDVNNVTTECYSWWNKVVKYVTKTYNSQPAS